MTSSCRGSSMVAEDCSEYDSHPDNILVHKLCYSTLIENFTKFDRNEIYRVRSLLQNLKVIFLLFALTISTRLIYILRG